MSNFAKIFGQSLAALMAAFSAYMFLQTGDWVAAVFCVGSVGYLVFFAAMKAKN